MAPISQARPVKTVKVLCWTISGFNTNSGLPVPRGVCSHRIRLWVYAHSNVCRNPNRLGHRSVNPLNIVLMSQDLMLKVSLMYSRAIVTSQNIVGELCYVAKKLSEKGNFPSYIGQQSCFSTKHILISNKIQFFFLKKNETSNFQKMAADGDTDPKLQT